jgi:hypothetical protein
MSLLGKKRHDDYHVFGWGISGGAGLNRTLLKHFIFR